MFTSSRQLFSWVAVSAAASTLSAAPATQPDLSDRIDALQAQIDQLKAQRAQQKQQEQQATIQQAVNEAERHSHFLDDEGLTAGYSNGRFLLRSDDGNFLLHPWLQFQFRQTTTYRQDVKAKGTEDDTQSGFEVRRLKFGVDGNLFSPDLTYLFQFAADRHTGTVGLEMAWVRYHFPGTPLLVRAGQFKDPLDHEQLAASRYFPAIDRTLIADVFANSEGFVKGATLIYDPANSIRAEAGFTGGFRNTNTNFQQFPTPGIPADWGAAGRAEYKLFGNWKDYDQITAYGIKHDSLVFGAGADYTEAGHTDTLLHVADAQYQNKVGLSLYGAYLGRYTARSTVAKGAYTYDPTARFQVSWALGRHWEPYGRYEYIHFDGREFAAHTQTNVQVITAGVNYYLYGLSAKLSLDASYLPNGSPVSDDGFGVLTDSGHNEFVGRAQLQVVF